MYKVIKSLQLAEFTFPVNKPIGYVESIDDGIELVLDDANACARANGCEAEIIAAEHDSEFDGWDAAILVGDKRDQRNLPTYSINPA